MNKTIASVLIVGSLAAGPVRSQTMNCLVAVVGGQAITLVDVRVAQEFGLFDRAAGETSGTDTAAVLEALIAQKLVAAMAREPGGAAKGDVDRAVEELRSKLGPEVFAAKLAKFGLREADLRPYLDERLRYERVVSARFIAAVALSRGDVEKYYRDVYVPGEKAKGLEPAPLENVLPSLEARARAELRARKVAEWVRTIRSQAEVRINRDCLK
jgi:hypothetical protein